MRRWKLYLPLTLAAGFAAAWLGFRGEKQRIEMGDGAPVPLKTQLRRIFVRPTNAVATLNEICRTSSRTPLTSQEEEECWLIIRDFTEDQLKSYLAELPPDDRRYSSWILTHMLFTRWAQIDPLAAMAAATDRPSTSAVLASWMSRDRDAALRWAASPEGAQMRDQAGNLAGQMYLREDPATAIGRLKTQFPDSVDGLMRGMAQMLGSNADSVREFFDLTQGQPHSYNWQYTISDLARHWTQSDLKEAVASSESFGLPPDQLASFRQQVLFSAFAAEPTLVLEHMIQGQETALDPETRKNIFSRFFYDHPEQATEWAVQNNHPEPLIDSLTSTVRRVQDYRRRVDSYALPVDRLRTQYQGWLQLQPDAADEWLQQQSAGTREALTGNSPDVSH